MHRTTAVGALIAVAASGAALLGSGPSAAQSNGELAAQVRGCLAVQRDRERLACYDAVFANLGSASADARAPAAPARTAPAAPEASPAARAAPAPSARAAAPTPTAPPAQRNAAPAPPARAASTSSSELRTVRIVEVMDRIPGAARFVADTGEVFVQTTGSGRMMLPNVPFEAEIQSGALGSRFLVPEGRARIRIASSD